MKCSKRKIYEKKEKDHEKGNWKNRNRRNHDGNVILFRCRPCGKNGRTEGKIIEVVPDGYINAESEEFLDNYVDMRQVVDYGISSEGLQLYLKDGSGYWLEK